ncbi:MAG: glycogen/starch synthase, partial [Desulfobaccales bacterium]
WELLSPKALEFYGHLNFMKGGLVFADLLNTVSNKYREEIQTSEFGFGLEGLFRERSRELYGILEGVDYLRWDPGHDAFLVAPYDREHLEGKKACKIAVEKRFGLNLKPGQPLVGMTTRFFERKGIDLVEQILDDLMALPMGFVIQGTGEERHQYLLQEIANRHPGKMGLDIGYSAELTHQIIAGSDIFLMPSRFEPCGLDQLYCLRYGTIPVVRATGGLDETIQEYDPQSVKGSGFKFSGYTPSEFMAAVRRALALYSDTPAWEALMRQVMAVDYSWINTAGPKYVELYRLAVEKRQRLLKG